jgi:hypothetical protein
MQDRDFPVGNFGPLLVLAYTLLVAGVTFALNIATGVRIVITVVALILFGVILGRSTPGHPPFGTEVDEEAIHGEGKH